MISVRRTPERSGAPESHDSHFDGSDRRRVKVRMQYFSVHSQQKKTYTIHPYRLMYFRGGLYLFAFVEEYKQIRTFAIERIETIEKTRDSFEKPKDFTVESYLESAFGVVKEEPFDVGGHLQLRYRRICPLPRLASSQQVREIGGGRSR
jgi:hypothetical protein